MRRREASINDVPIREQDRRIRGARAADDTSTIPLR
jgi:nuclear transport factor 2 (NTF2) superfamily protein